MARRGILVLVARLRVCVQPDGAVRAVVPLMSSGYAALDQFIVGKIRRWRYRPHASEECSRITLRYPPRR